MDRKISMTEICICAAIKTKHGKVIRGHRHVDCFYTMERMGIHEPDAEQGFVTSKNRFVNRDSGRKLQDAAGMQSVDREGYHGNSLYSEDLY